MKKKFHKLLALAAAAGITFTLGLGLAACGESAYDIAVKNGFQGTEQEWLESLKGEDGKDGKDGKDGETSADGMTPHIGRAEDGEEEGYWYFGDQKTEFKAVGEDGKSAYEVYVAWFKAQDGNAEKEPLSEQDWLASLKGEQGAEGQKGPAGESGSDGKSAYDVYVEQYKKEHGDSAEGALSEEEWLASLRGTVWFSGTAAPEDAEITGMMEGDFYLRTYSGFTDIEGYEIYRYEGGNWVKFLDMAQKSEGSTEEKDSYYITDLNSLLEFRASVEGGNNYEGKTVYLTEDIDLASVENWDPIGEFRGTFDGQNKTICNLKIEKPEQVNAGLFATGGGVGTVKDLVIEGVSIKAQSAIGAVAGGRMTVSNVTVCGNIEIEGNYKVGGVIGESYETVTGCNVTGEEGSYIKGVFSKEDYEGDNVGGIIGYTGELNSLRESISDCHVSKITVIGTRKVGGVVGYLHHGQGVTDCSFEEGTVECNATEEYVGKKGVAMIAIGGIVGQTHIDGPAQSIKDCSVKNITVKVPQGFTFETTVKDDVKLTGAILGGARGCETVEGIAHAKEITAENNTAENVTYEAKLKDVVYSKYAGGGSPYISSIRVYNKEDLLSMKTLQAAAENNVFNHAQAGENHTAVNFAEGCEIDLQEVAWTPLSGFRYDYFGNNTVIKNMTMNSAQWRGGFVDSMGDCTVNGFTFENATVLGEQVGVVAGHSENGTIENVRLKGTVSVKYEKTSQNEEWPAIGAFLGVVAASAKIGENVVVDAGAQVTIDFGTEFTTKCEKYNGLLVGYLAFGTASLSGAPAEEKGALITVKNMPDVNVGGSGSSARPDDGVALDPGANLVIEGGTITLSHTAFNYFNSTEGVLSGNITFKNVHFVGNVDETGTGYVLTLGFDSTATVVFEGCTFEKMYCAVYINTNNAGNANVTIKDCTFTDTKWGVAMSTPENKDKTVHVTFEGTNNGLTEENKFEKL